MRIERRTFLAALPLSAVFPTLAAAQDKGVLRVGILGDINNFDPQKFTQNNFPLIKNLYDSLIEYTPDGRAIPSIATAWTIAPDNLSVQVVLRPDVTFSAGGKLDANAVAATLKKAADPAKGQQVYATMAIVKDWTVENATTIRLNFRNPVPERQITDLLQFISVIDPAGIDTVETKPAGSGAFTLVERKLGQSIRLAGNPHYWRPNEPAMGELVLTVFGDNEAAAAALESGAVDIVYGGGSRAAVRLRSAGYQLVQGPGPLVMVFRINATRGPFKNEKFRQAFQYLMDRAAILRIGFANLGEVTALPWAPNSPAADRSYDKTLAFDLDRARALLKESGLSPAEMSDWKLLVTGNDQGLVAISQLVQATLAKVGITIQLDLKQDSELVDAMLGGKFDAVFGGVGNVQKFPSRIATNSIYRTTGNAVLGDPNPFPSYVQAIERVNTTFGAGDATKAAYDNLNKVLTATAFGIATNTYDIGLLVMSPKVTGVTQDIDNMLVARTLRLGT